MKYQCQVEINAPIDDVVQLWNNEAHFHRWQDGFESITVLEGDKGEVGSKSRILLKSNKRSMVLTETILINDLPREKKGLYEHEHMDNTQSSRFETIDENTTRYISEVEYVKFKGFLPKLMGMLFPRMFKKQSQKWMDQFKIFGEGQLTHQNNHDI